MATTIEKLTDLAADDYAEKLNECYVNDFNAFVKGAQWERNRDKWISANDHPPIFEKNKNFSIDVLVTDGDKVRKGYYHYGGGYWFGQFMNGDAITHWCPLPEPPKQKED